MTLLTELRNALRTAEPTLFAGLQGIAHFDLGSEDHAHAMSMAAVPDGESVETAKGFFLPMPLTWVEDGRSGIGLRRMHGGPLGLVECGFEMIEVFPGVVEIEGDRISARGSIPDRLSGEMTSIFEALLLGRARFPAKTLFVRIGMVVVADVGEPWRMTAAVSGQRLFAIHDGSILCDRVMHEGEPTLQPMMADFLQNFQAAATQVLAINSPANIVVKKESSESIVSVNRKGKRRMKSRKSVRYLVLPRQEAYRLVTGDRSAEGIKRAAHARRRHWRTLRAERFKEEKRGTRVCVRECWVGPRERVDGDVRYKVCLDLGLELDAPTEGAERPD